MAAGSDRLGGFAMVLRRIVFALCTLPSAAWALIWTFMLLGDMSRSTEERAQNMSTFMVLLYAAGAFAVVLGILHFTFPTRFGFFAVLPTDGPPPRRIASGFIAMR